MVPYLDDLLEFDRKLTRRFALPLERLDKYHRSASFFLPRNRTRKPKKKR